jgi:hypothetical protein
MTKRILSSTVGALLTATVFLVVLTGAALAHEHITQDEFEQAARDGKLKNAGLKLTDTARGIFKALAAANGDHSGGGVAEGFSIRVITPYNWVAYRFKQAREEYRPMTWADLAEEDTEDILRVRAYPDSPTQLGGQRGYSVQHVVLRHPDKKKRQSIIVQPASKVEFTEELQTSGGADLVLIGMEVTFSMHDLETVRNKKGEFLVTVVGGSGDDYGDEEADAEKNYKVKKKHLDDLGLKQLKR